MTKRLRLICLIFLWNLVGARGLVAQDLVITNARILDGNGGTIKRGTVVVRNGRIASVSEGAATAVVGTREIDVQGMTVMPGMIETHVHLLLVDRTRGSQQALDEWIEQELPGDLRKYLESGFTTALSPGDHPSPILRVKRRIELGELQGPRLLVSGPVFTAPGGHPATTVCGGAPDLCRDSLAVEVDDAEIAREKVRELAEAGVDAIKAVYQATPTPTSKLADDVLAAIAEEAQLHNIPLIAHAPVIEDALRAVELGAKRLVHPPTRGVTDGNNLGRALREASIPFSTTTRGGAPIVDEGGVMRNHRGREYTSESEARMNRRLVRIRTLWDDGVTIAFGTDRVLNNPADDISHKIETLSRVFSPEEIITVLTRNAATYLDLSDEIWTPGSGEAC